MCRIPLSDQTQAGLDGLRHSSFVVTRFIGYSSDNRMNAVTANKTPSS